MTNGFFINILILVNLANQLHIFRVVQPFYRGSPDLPSIFYFLTEEVVGTHFIPILPISRIYEFPLTELFCMNSLIL